MTNQSTAPHVKKLIDLGACDGPGESIEYASQHATAQEAWDACKRADWMLWLLARVAPVGSDARRLAIRCAVACARTALPYYQAEDDRAEGAAILDALDAWATGQAPETDLLAVRNRARALRNRLWSDAARATAWAAADAAYAWAAANAAYAANARAATRTNATAYANANARARAVAYQQHLATMADLIRTLAPVCPI